MPYKKGNIKKGGRQKGSINKNTETMLAFVDYIVKKGYEDVDGIWDELKAKEKIDALVKLLEYRIPKHARVENSEKIPPSVTINFLAATPERIQQQNTLDITPHEEINKDGGIATTD